LKKIIIIFCFFFITVLWAKTQNLYEFIPDSSYFNESVMFSGYGLANSNALTEEFINTWINSGFISDEIKNSVLNRMQNSNLAGTNISGKVYYIRDHYNTLSESGYIGYFAGFESNYLLSIRFNNDLFRLAFIGNESYENKTISIDNNKFVSLAWDKAGGGLYKRVSNENGIALGGISLNILRARQYNKIDVNKANLFTASNGEFIDVDAKFKGYQSDNNASSGILAFNGYGISTDLFYRFTYKNKLNYYFAVSNFGIIKMNKKSLSINHDTSFRFSGIQLNEIIQNNSISWNTGSPDSIIDSYIPEYESGIYYINTPCTLSAGFSWIAVKNRLNLNMNIDYMLFIPYLPKVQIQSDIHLNKNFSISPSFIYGGFNKGNAGIEINYKNKYFQFYCGSNDINGLLYPHKSSGMSAYLSLLFFLKK